MYIFQSYFLSIFKNIFISVFCLNFKLNIIAVEANWDKLFWAAVRASHNTVIILITLIVFSVLLFVSCVILLLNLNICLSPFSAW